MECTPTMMLDPEGEDVSDGSWRGSRQGWGHRNPAWCSGTPEPSLPGGAFSARITWDRITQLDMGRGVSLGRAGGRRWGLSEASHPEAAFGGPVSRNVVPSRTWAWLRVVSSQLHGLGGALGVK